MPTTPADYGSAEPPGQLSLRQVPDFYELSGGCRITPDLIPLAVPELVSGLAALVTRLQRREDLVCPRPLLITVQQNLLAADLLRQVPNFIEIPRRFPGLLRTSFSSRFPGLG